MPPRAVVPAPPAAPPRLGLIASAILPDDPDERWQNGFAVDPEPCSGVTVHDICDHGDITPAVEPPDFTYQPFEVDAAIECSTMSGTERRNDDEARARRLLLGCESAAIASELWTGALAAAAGWDNRALANEPDSDLVTAGASTPAVGLACLEQALGECACGQRGMIHAPRQLATLWAEASLVRREGQYLLTALDTIVVPDAGYDGSAPDGSPAADGSVWAYATGMVSVRRSQITIRDSVAHTAQIGDATRGANTHLVIAARMAAATWDGCCHLAAEFDIDLCTTGGS